MRIVIVTDSLGIPRDYLPIEDCWVDKFYSRHNEDKIYTLMLPGLSIKKIYEYRDKIMNLYNPDIIIFHFGIVDASRRALPDTLSIVISKIKLFSRILRPLISKYHYLLTKLFNIHRVRPDKFIYYLNEIMSLKSEKTDIYFISIAPSGEFLINKTFNIKNDINLYNDLIKSVCISSDIKFINPYRNYKSEQIVNPNDGHHLTTFSHDLVDKALIEIGL